MPWISLVNLKKTNRMSKIMSIEEQINSLRDLRENLYDFRSEIQIKMDDLSLQVDHLEKDDVFREIMAPYRTNYYTPLGNEVQHVIEDLNHHLEYIDRLIELVRPDIFIDEK